MKALPLNLRAALSYQRRGWPVFPAFEIKDGQCSCGNSDCTSPGKHPRIRGGFKNATLDRRQIKSWWRKWPTANVGIATGAESGLLVLDIDPRHGGLDSLTDLLDGETLPDVPTVETGGGGLHLYFAYTAGSRIASRSGLKPGLDVRADGAYIVAPPSNHESGKKYRWKT